MNTYFCSYICNNCFSNGIFSFPEQVVSTADLRILEQKISSSLDVGSDLEVHLLYLRRISDKKTAEARPFFISFMAGDGEKVSLGSVVMKAKGISSKEDISFIEKRLCKGPIKMVRLISFMELNET